MKVFALDEGLRDIAQLAVGVLRQVDQDGEGVLGAAAALRHEDPLGLLDDGARVHRGLQLFGHLARRLVQVHVGERHPCVGGEHARQLDARLVDGVLVDAVDVGCGSHLSLQRDRDAQTAVRPLGAGIGGSSHATASQRS